jgi:hypothetical protein
MEKILGSHFVIQKPCKRMIRYNGSNYFLSLPYCVFSFCYVYEMQKNRDPIGAVHIELPLFFDDYVNSLRLS